MESLLKWGIENTPEGTERTVPSTERIKELDPEIIDMILGKSDAVVMKASASRHDCKGFAIDVCI